MGTVQCPLCKGTGQYDQGEMTAIEATLRDAEQRTKEHLQEILAAAHAVVLDHDLQCEDSNGKIDRLAKAIGQPGY